MWQVAVYLAFCGVYVLMRPVTVTRDFPTKAYRQRRVWGLLLWGGVTAVSLLILAYFLRTALAITGGQLGAPLDDAWIHFQFARNLSQGHGFSYNPGEPQPGSTAPLWTLLLAGVGLLTAEARHFLVAALILSAGFMLLAVWLAYGFTRWAGGNQWIALLAALGTLLAGRFVWAGLAGMETTAFAALSLAAIWLYSRDGLRPLPTLLFALSSQMRPEGHLLFALALADTAYQWLRVNGQWSIVNTRGLARQIGVALAVYLLVALPYTLFSLRVTGHPLPNTFYAKAGSKYLFSWRTLTETLTFHWRDNPVAFLLLLAGLWPLWQRSRLAAAWLLLLPLFVGLIIDQVWHYGRYTLPLIPLQMVTAALGLQWLWAQSQHLGLRSRWATAVPLLLIISLFLWAGGRTLPHWATTLGQNSQEIIAVDVAIAHWLAANTPPDALIAVDDIGAIGFLSGRRLLDLNGLISPEMWPVIKGEPEGRPRNEATARLLSTLQPDYLAVFPEWHWEVATNPLTVRERAQFAAETKTIIGEQRAFIYEMVYWPYLATAVPATSLSVQFGEGIRLLGYDLDVHDQIGLVLYWRSEQPVAESYDVFVHVLNEQGEIVAQADSAPVAGLAPTTRWQPGDIIRDVVTIPLPPALPAGEYALRAGLYRRETGERLTAVGPAALGDMVDLGSVVVP
ncbi:MAG: hypothetical protein BroJett015_31270 [Chloroflexota bacterium]|nr:hypothetical protein [Ardenticatenaceae bacterium]GIK57464.1 MAG: hypothetical protein BroJett015_31270 [Chloroflexota bacterium]